MAHGGAKNHRHEAVTMSFRELIYTDCQASESLNGGSGFQYQARTEQTSPSDEDAGRNLLYVPSRQLLSTRRPVADYPRSMAYGRDGSIAISTGEYLGAESGGARQGNFISHILFTDDSADLLPTRPAQLYEAPVWNRSKMADQRMPTHEAPLPFDSLMDVAALQRLVKAVPESVVFLSHVVTMFEEAAASDYTRLAISCSDLTTTMQWLAVGTLLLPGRLALACSFQVFVDDVNDVPQRVTAVHPPTNGAHSSVLDLPGMNGIDLDALVCSPCSTSDRARFWAERFVNGDPYDIVEAIDLADDLNQVDEFPGRISAKAALLGEPLEDANEVDAVLATLATAPTDLMAEYGPALVGALRHGITPLPVDQWYSVLRSLGRSGTGSDEVSDELRIQLIRMAALDPETAEAVTSLILDDPSGAQTWIWANSVKAHAAALDLATIIVAAHDQDVPELLTAAAISNVPVPWPSVNDRMSRFARAWASTSVLGRNRAGWLFRDQVTDQVVDVLNEGFKSSARAQYQRSLTIGSWDWLEGTPWTEDKASPLSIALVAKGLPKLSPDDRRSALADLVHQNSPRVWADIWTNKQPTLDELEEWCQVAPTSLDLEDFCLFIVAILSNSERHQSVWWRLLARVNASPMARLPEQLSDLSVEWSQCGAQLHNIERQEAVGEAAMMRLCGRLHLVGATVMEQYLARALKTLWGAGSDAALFNFVSFTKAQSRGELSTLLRLTVSTEIQRTVRLGFAIAGSSAGASYVREAEDFLDQWIREADRRTAASVGKEIARDWPTEWAQLEKKRTLGAKLRTLLPWQERPIRSSREKK